MTKKTKLHIQEYFFIEKLYNISALVWFPTVYELWPLLVMISTQMWVKIKLFLQERSVRGSLWCTRYFCQQAPASFSWAPPSPLLHSWWQQKGTLPSPESPGSGSLPPERQDGFIIKIKTRCSRWVSIWIYTHLKLGSVEN